MKYLLPFLLLAAACAPLKPGSAETLRMIEKDHRWVVVDAQNQERYEVFFYDNGPDAPSEGLYRIVQNGKIGYADASTHAIVIAPQYDYAYPFENGKAKVSTNCQTVKDGEYSTWTSEAWVMIDREGKQ
ncbi:MAG: WG repeat-containing protein [Bacteroidetes bacterium]|nr:MAG: WG repeat-containing protein [Bacteroidota bacterium]